MMFVNYLLILIWIKDYFWRKLSSAKNLLQIDFTATKFGGKSVVGTPGTDAVTV